MQGPVTITAAIILYNQLSSCSPGTNMAVAAMVARQMRENQEKRDQPHSDWTEEQRELYELKQKSKSKLKVAAEPVKCVGTVLCFSQTSWWRSWRGTSPRPRALPSTTTCPSSSPWRSWLRDSSSPSSVSTTAPGPLSSSNVSRPSSSGAEPGLCSCGSSSPSHLQLSEETRRSKTTARRKENRKNIPYQVDLPSRLSLIRQLPAVFSPLSLQLINVLALGSRSTCQKLFLSVTARLGRRVWCGEVKIKTMNLNNFLLQCYERRI